MQLKLSKYLLILTLLFTRSIYSAASEQESVTLDYNAEFAQHLAAASQVFPIIITVNDLKDPAHAINKTDIGGKTVMHHAAQAGDYKFIKIITGFNKKLNLNLDINKQDNSGFTALHYACAAPDFNIEKRYRRTCKYLLSAGADTKIKTKFGDTAENLILLNQNS